MNQALIAFLTSIGILAGILVFVEVGRRIGARPRKQNIGSNGEDSDLPGRSTVDGAVFGLMGLLLAFTVSGTLSRWEDRRELAVSEVNAIGTAWLRIDLLPESAQGSMREMFRNYVDARIDTYRTFTDEQSLLDLHGRATDLQTRIWNQTIEVGREVTPPTATMLLVPALNEMFDLAATRFAAKDKHPPAVLYILLVLLVLTSALVAGHAMAPSRARSWTHVLAFALALAASIYVILDMEYPRLGFIRIDAVDELLVDLRRTMD